MNTTLEPRNQNEYDIDLRELFAAVWRGKKIIMLTTTFCVFIGLAYAIYKPDVYTASALLAPASDDVGSRVSGQLAGLASLAGVNIGSGSNNKTAIAKEVLQSRAFLTNFIRRHNLAIPLMASKAWDKIQGKWVIDAAFYDVAADKWVGDDKGQSLEPTDWDLVKEFRGSISVIESKDNGMVTVSITSLSPVAAKEWVERLVKDLNDYMRDQDVAEAEASIKYLEGKLHETNVAGMQQVFYQLIESQTRTIMLANAQREYVFKTIDPAVVPQEKSGPKREVILVLSIVVGMMLGTSIVFIFAFFRTETESESKI